MTRVVVTGLGAVTPIGNDAAKFWQALLAGRSGVDYARGFDASAFGPTVVGEVRGFCPEMVLPTKELRHMDRNVQFAAVAALQAVADAGLDASNGLGPDAGVIFAAGAGGYELLHENEAVLRGDKAGRRLSPFFLANVLPDASSGYIALLTGARGPNLGVVSACATGASALGEASEIIKRGDAEIMVCGGAEAPLTPFLYGAFYSLRAIATPAEDPGRSCRPFDLHRGGFVVAEGAGAAVLESWEHAQRRGARAYAELIGYGASNDAFDMVASEELGRGPVLAGEMALRKAGIDPAIIGHVNAHGTATLLNDRVETRALKRLFGEHAYDLAVSGTKSMTGHMMGAAGAVEAIACVMALHDGAVPPTTNYETPDPDCDLDYVANVARQMPALEAAMTASIGLGGHNAALIFRRV